LVKKAAREALERAKGNPGVAAFHLENASYENKALQKELATLGIEHIVDEAHREFPWLSTEIQHSLAGLRPTSLRDAAA